MRQATTASRRARSSETWPVAASAPIASSTGTAGRGSPSCSTSTSRNSTSAPSRARNAITALLVERGHGALGIALAGGDALGRHLLDAGHVLGSQPDLQRGHVLLQVLPPLGAGDGDHVLPAPQYPGQRQLCRRDALR